MTVFSPTYTPPVGGMSGYVRIVLDDAVSGILRFTIRSVKVPSLAYYYNFIVAEGS